MSKFKVDLKTKEKAKCEYCGHTQLLGFKDKVICTHCKHYIFKDLKTKFEYRINEKRMKESRTMQI